MLNLLLKHNEVEALHILSVVIYSPVAPIQLINKDILHDKLTLKNHITSLNNTFIAINADELYLEITDGTLELKNYDFKRHDDLLVNVYNYFIQDSLVYKTLLLMMTHKDPDKEMIMSGIHLSEGYLSKVLKQINEFLAPAHIMITSRKKKLVFEGPKINWIFFTYYCRQFFSIIPTPFKKQTGSFFNLIDTTFMDLSEIDRDDRQQLIMAIYNFEKSGTNYLQDEESLALWQFLARNELAEINTTPAIVTVSEQLFLTYHLMLHFSSSSANTTSLRQSLSKEIQAFHLLQPQNKLVADSLLIADELMDFLFIAPPKKSPLYNEVVHLILTKQLKFRTFRANIDQLFDLKPDFLPDFSDNSNPITQKLTAFSNKFLPTLPITPESQAMWETYEERLLSSLYGIIRTQTSSALIVLVEMKFNLPLGYNIKTAISSLFSPDSLIFTTDITQADVIISDHHINTAQSKPLFYILDSNNDSVSDALYLFLLKKMVKKKRQTTFTTLK